MKSRALWYAFSALLWAAVPVVAMAAGLVPCETAAACNICTLGKLIQNVINFAIGLSIPLAAILFSYAGWLYFSNRENMTKIEQAHRIFTSVLIGFAIAIAGWLVVQTILKTLAPGYQSWTTFTCNADRPMDKKVSDLFQQSGLPGLSTTAPPAGFTVDAQNNIVPINDQPLGQPSGFTVDGDGNIVPVYDIAGAAAARIGDNTSAGPDGGNLACAWEVNRVLRDAGIPSIDGDSVAGMEQELRDNGRGVSVRTEDAQPGNIIIWKEGNVSHVGICQEAGCTKAISNSSANATFNNISGSTFLGVAGRVYRVNK